MACVVACVVVCVVVCGGSNGFDPQRRLTLPSARTSITHGSSVPPQPNAPTLPHSFYATTTSQGTFGDIALDNIILEVESLLGPTAVPIPSPTEVPTPEPTAVPIPAPSSVPVPAPTDVPIPSPTPPPGDPTREPTVSPTSTPTYRPPYGVKIASTQNSTEVSSSAKLVLTSTYVSYDPHTSFAWEAASTTDGSELSLVHGVTTATPVNIDNLVLKGHMLKGGSRSGASRVYSSARSHQCCTLAASTPPTRTRSAPPVTPRLLLCRPHLLIPP